MIIFRRIPLSPKLVTIATFTTPEETELARNVLEAESIKSYPEGEATVGMVWFWGNAIGGIQLQVSDLDAERAKIILANKVLDDQNDDFSDQSCLDSEDPTSDEEDQAAKVFEQGDDLAKKAWIASVLGIFILPPLLNTYSLWLIFKITYRDYPMSEAGLKKFNMALFFNVISSFLICLAISLLVLR
jgi:hypothetical protein